MSPTPPLWPIRTAGSSWAYLTGDRTRPRIRSRSSTVTQKNLTFDLRTGVSYDYYPDGERKTPTAIIRNGQIYVSASSTCAYFGLECTQGNIVFGTKYYPYIRIHNADASLSDQQFRGSVTTPYLIQLQNYYRTVTAQTGGEPGGRIPRRPPPSCPRLRRAARTSGGAGLCLALRCDTGEAGEAVLDALAREGRAALLLFPADRLAQRDDLIRRAHGGGACHRPVHTGRTRLRRPGRSCRPPMSFWPISEGPTPGLCWRRTGRWPMRWRLRAGCAGVGT